MLMEMNKIDLLISEAQIDTKVCLFSRIIHKNVS